MRIKAKTNEIANRKTREKNHKLVHWKTEQNWQIFTWNKRGKKRKKEKMIITKIKNKQGHYKKITKYYELHAN